MPPDKPNSTEQPGQQPEKKNAPVRSPAEVEAERKAAQERAAQRRAVEARDKEQEQSQVQAVEEEMMSDDPQPLESLKPKYDDPSQSPEWQRREAERQKEGEKLRKNRKELEENNGRPAFFNEEEGATQAMNDQALDDIIDTYDKNVRERQTRGQPGESPSGNEATDMTENGAANETREASDSKTEADSVEAFLLTVPLQLREDVRKSLEFVKADPILQKAIDGLLHHCKDNPEALNHIGPLLEGVHQEFGGNVVDGLRYLSGAALHPDYVRTTMAKDPKAKKALELVNRLDITNIELLKVFGQAFNEAPSEKNGEGISETDQKKMIADVKKALEGVDLASMTPADRDQKIGSLMFTHGISMTEQNGEWKANAPTDGMEMFINKLVGIFMVIGSVFSKIQGSIDKALGKKKPIEKGVEVDDEFTSEEMDKAKERIGQEQKTKPIEEIKADKNKKLEELQKENGELVKKIKDTQKKLDGRKGTVEDFQKQLAEAKDEASRSVILDQLKLTEKLGNDIDKEQAQHKEQQNVINQKIREIEADRRVLEDMDKEKLAKSQETIASIPKDGKWHLATEVKEGQPGWNYKIGKDGRAYMSDMKTVQVFANGEWTDIAKDANITDNKTAKKFTETFLKNGDTRWSTIASANEGWEYAIDPATKTLIGRKEGKHKQYEPALNTWADRAEFTHA